MHQLDDTVQMMPQSSNLLDNHISILDEREKDSIDFDDTKQFNETSKASVDPNATVMKKATDEVTINDMLAEVRKLWFELDQNEGKLDLELNTVAWKIVALKALPDLSTAQKYIRNTL